ncbi:hypothetical protein F5884DRAFT_237160 [Xylogone sp. PMI_703]|nr:hypothetical protein F5884DRAFT_237160 [Xylogone sp. PMI_703]
MLERFDSRKSHRRRSASSTHQQYGSIDPTISHQHAHIAAAYAFALAQKREGTDQGCSVVGPRKNTSKADTSLQSQNLASEHQDVACPSEQVIRRQQSIRFAGPNAIPRNKPLARGANRHSVAAKENTSSLRQSTCSEIYVPEARCSPSRSTSGKATSRQEPHQGYPSTLDAYNVYYTPEDDVASLPSSYRRVRRSRSMFISSRSHQIFSNFSVSGRHSTEPRRAIFHGRSRSTKSAKFRRDNCTSSISETRKNSAPIQTAQARHIYQFKQQPSAEQSDLLYNYHKQKQNRPFKKSLRRTKSFAHLVENAPHCDITVKGHSFREKARKISTTIRSKFRRVFARYKEDTATTEDQQSDIEDIYFEDFSQGVEIEPESCGNLPQQSPITASRAHSNSAPSSHEEPPAQQHRTSLSFLTSKSIDTSRVTSWTSTTSNKVTRQVSQEELTDSKQFLSTNRKTNHALPQTPICRPTTSTDRLSSPLSTPVNSARVYSALMRRLHGQASKEQYDMRGSINGETL